MNAHRGVPEKNPGAANVGIAGKFFGGEDGLAERQIGIVGERLNERAIHTGLRPGIGEAGGSPDGNGAAVWSEEQGFGEALRVNVLEEAVEAIHEEKYGQAIAVLQCGGVGIVEEVGEGPLFDRTVTDVVHQKLPLIDAVEKLLLQGLRVEIAGDDARDRERFSERIGG